MRREIILVLVRERKNLRTKTKTNSDHVFLNCRNPFFSFQIALLSSCPHIVARGEQRTKTYIFAACY
ncbi:DUF1661 domain-containing protein [Porphyromonas gulae]|uniref:DUF1661 domain-containing protein n=1 Tax=Porphyromonas gulae TaxID=111105 RepID=UPI001269AA97